MRLLFKLPLLLLIFVFVLGCSSSQEKQPIEDNTDYSKIYQRDTEIQESQQIIFASPTNYEGFINEYSSVEILETKLNSNEVKVLFTAGAHEGHLKWTDKIIYKTSGVSKENFYKGMVVIVNNQNPKDPKNTTYERWQVGIVYDTTKLAEKGVIVVEFPKSKNEFFGSKETYHHFNVRYIQEPKIKDTRKFIYITD